MPSASTIRSLVADRFELLDELPRSNDGQMFCARDVAFGEVVAVKLLGAGCSMEAAAREALETAVRRAQSARHPHLLRHDALDAATGVQVREWIHGFSLLDLLRRRRELTADDVFLLLPTLPATLDYLAAQSLPLPRPLLGKIFIQFEPAVAPEKLLTQPVPTWPAFALKLNPLTIPTSVADPARDTTRTLITMPHTATVSDAAAGPRLLAELLYELLGGRQREPDTRRYSPLSTLSETGNGVLRRALLAAPHADCQALWRDLRTGQASNLAPPVPLGAVRPRPRPPVIPQSLLGQPQPGDALALTPQNPAAASIQLIARTQFKIGRSFQSADFVTRLFPETERNEIISNRIGRVHVVAERVGGRLLLRDGNGSTPSLNGSHLDGHLLSPDHPTPLTRRALLSLGDDYFLDVIPLLQPPPRCLPDLWPGRNFPAPEPPGALVCEPRHGQPSLRRCVWLFSEIGFGLDARGRLVWDTRGAGESPAAWHHHRGCFWVRNQSLGAGTLALDNIPLTSDQIAPITTGQTVRLGSSLFTAEVC